MPKYIPGEDDVYEDEDDEEEYEEETEDSDIEELPVPTREEDNPLNLPEN